MGKKHTKQWFFHEAVAEKQTQFCRDITGLGRVKKIYGSLIKKDYAFLFFPNVNAVKKKIVFPLINLEHSHKWVHNRKRGKIYTISPKEVWSSCLNCPVDQETNSGDFTDLAFQFITNGTTQDLETFFVTAWPIWYNQNQIVHESSSSLPIQIWETARRTVKDYKGALINCISAEIQPSFVLDCPTSWHS